MTPQTSQAFVLRRTTQPPLLTLWWRWILANALGELLGLGFIAALGGGLIGRFGEPRTTTTVLLFAALMILLGACEGLVLGVAQWLAVHPFFPTPTRRE